MAISPEKQHELETQFFVKVGQTKVVWAQVEGSLCKIFTAITKMESTLARRVFFSARSFQGRNDMLKAAIECPTLGFAEKDELDFIKAVVEKSGIYASVRNIIAHDPAYFFGFDGHECSHKYVFVDGKYDRFLGGENALEIEQLSNFHLNVSHLFTVMECFLQNRGGKGPLPKFLEIARQLPKKPRVHKLPPKYVELLRSLTPDPFVIQS